MLFFLDRFPYSIPDTGDLVSKSEIVLRIFSELNIFCITYP